MAFTTPLGCGAVPPVATHRGPNLNYPSEIMRCNALSDNDLRERVELMVAQSALRQPHRSYLERAHDHLGMMRFRQQMVAWMLKVQVSDDTVACSVDLIDRCFSIWPLGNRRILFLIGVSCVFIGSKLHDTPRVDLVGVLLVCTLVRH